MRSCWLTGWLLVVLLACSAVDPRAAMADAPAVPAAVRDPKGKPATPPASPALPARPDEQQFRAVFTLSGYTRAQKIEELSAGWSPRNLLLIRAAELAQQTTQALTRAAASVVPHGPALRSTGRAIAEIRILAVSALVAPGYPLLPLHQWLQVVFTYCLAPVLGLAISVLWLVRRHATPASADHDGAH